MVEKFTLQSGKEITYYKAGWKQKAEIWDQSVEYFNKDIPFSLVVCGKIIVYCKIATYKQLDNDEFTIQEIYEIGTTIFNEMFMVELNKKKLK